MQHCFCYTDITDFHRFHGFLLGLHAEGIPSGDTRRLDGVTRRGEIGFNCAEIY